MFEETTYCVAARHTNRYWDNGIYSCNVCVVGNIASTVQYQVYVLCTRTNVSILQNPAQHCCHSIYSSGALWRIAKVPHCIECLDTVSLTFL